MRPVYSEQKLEKPHSWSQLKYGQWIRDSIQTRLDELYPKLFGYHMLKLGGLSCELLSERCNIHHQMKLDLVNPLHNIIAEHHQLPFIAKSIDVVLLAHQFGYDSDPHYLLREVNRVLIDDGYIILTGVNPLSLIGLANFMPWNNYLLRKAHLYNNGRMFTINRIKDWLSLLNYQIVSCEQYALCPMHKQSIVRTCLESSIGTWGSSLGGLYFIVARKRRYPLQTRRASIKIQRRFSPVNVNCRVESEMEGVNKIEHP